MELKVLLQCFTCVCVFLSDSVRDRMQREYLGDPMYTFENANHASKACGPLVQWAIAQVSRVTLHQYM